MNSAVARLAALELELQMVSADDIELKQAVCHEMDIVRADIARIERLERLLTETRRMRGLQRSYFADRTHGALAAAKSAEADVDRLVVDLTVVPRQVGLFGGGR